MSKQIAPVTMTAVAHTLHGDIQGIAWWADGQMHVEADWGDGTTVLGVDIHHEVLGMRVFWHDFGGNPVALRKDNRLSMRAELT